VLAPQWEQNLAAAIGTLAVAAQAAPRAGYDGNSSVKSSHVGCAGSARVGRAQ
jgi:hypothetical protein